MVMTGKLTRNIAVDGQRPEFKVAVDARRHGDRHLITAWQLARREYHSINSRLMWHVHAGVQNKAAQ